MVDSTYQIEERKWLNTAFQIAIFSIFCSVAIPNFILLLIRLTGHIPDTFDQILLGSIPVQLSLLLPLALYQLVKYKSLFLTHSCELLKLQNWKFKYIEEALKIEFMIFIPLCIIAFGIRYLLVYLGYDPSSPITLILEKADLKGVLLIFFIAVFVAPIGEEIIFRRIFFGFSEKLMSKTPAMIITSFAFATLHGGIVQLIPLIILGCILQQLYIKNQSLFPCIVLHAIHNFITMSIFTAIWLYAPPALT